MTSEIWQFAAFLSAVAVAFVLWLNIIYMPGRTLEQRYDGEEVSRRPPGEETYVPDGGEATRSSSDPTR